jgi:prevent-host-death family protein
VFPAVRSVNVHQAKTQFSRLIDAAHAGETIVVAKDGKPWARLVPLEQGEPKRQPGVLKGQLLLPAPDDLLGASDRSRSLPPSTRRLFSSDGLSARYPRPALVVGRA